MPTTLNFRTFGLNLLRVFDVVMDERNLMRAAERLSLTQPAVSNALKRLKESIGEELQTPRHSWCDADADAAGRSPVAGTAQRREQRARRAGARRIQPADRCGRLPHRDGRCRHHHLRAAAGRADRTQSSAREPSKLLERGEADLTVGHFPETVAALSVEGGDASLRHHHLQESGFVCLMRQCHPLAKGKLTLDDYCAAHHLLVIFSGHTNGRADQALAALNRERRVMLTVNPYFTAGKLVANRNRLTLLPASFVNAAGFQEEVVTRPLPFALESLRVTMLWHVRHDRVSSHQWLRARLIEAVQAATA